MMKNSLKRRGRGLKDKRPCPPQRIKVGMVSGSETVLVRIRIRESIPLDHAVLRIHEILVTLTRQEEVFCFLLFECTFT
jgi:hypothetical protein